MRVIEAIGKPVLGLVTSGGSLALSFQDITLVAQGIAAFLAVAVGFGTLRLTYLKIKQVKKNG